MRGKTNFESKLTLAPTITYLDILITYSQKPTTLKLCHFPSLAIVISVFSVKKFWQWGSFQSASRGTKTPIRVRNTLLSQKEVESKNYGFGGLTRVPLAFLCRLIIESIQRIIPVLVPFVFVARGATACWLAAWLSGSVPRITILPDSLGSCFRLREGLAIAC